MSKEYSRDELREIALANLDGPAIENMVADSYLIESSEGVDQTVKDVVYGAYYSSLKSAIESMENRTEDYDLILKNLVKPGEEGTRYAGSPEEEKMVKGSIAIRYQSVSFLKESDVLELYDKKSEGRWVSDLDEKERIKLFDLYNNFSVNRFVKGLEKILKEASGEEYAEAA